MVVKDRTKHFKTYKDCFVGSEAVDYLIRENLAVSRRDAVELCNSLMLEFGLFEHITKDYPFKDEHLFFRFVGSSASPEPPLAVDRKDVPTNGNEKQKKSTENGQD